MTFVNLAPWRGSVHEACKNPTFGQRLATLPVERRTIKTDNGDVCGANWAMAEMIGFRPTMEDAFVATKMNHPFSNWSLFAVLDGHGGGQCSELVSRKLQSVLELELKNGTESDMENALVSTFQKLDTDFCSQFLTCGSTCVAVVVTETHYWIANLGDSRSIVLESAEFGNWTKPVDPTVMSESELGIRFATTDQKPSCEKQRITASGHTVVAGRIDCSLSVSRAFGDYSFKRNSKLLLAEQAVISLPEITKLRRGGNDEFIILGCDGVFGNILSNNEMAIAVRAKCAEQDELQNAAKDIIDLSLRSSSFDNMTVLIINILPK